MGGLKSLRIFQAETKCPIEANVCDPDECYLIDGGIRNHNPMASKIAGET